MAKVYFEILRPLNCAMAAFGVFIGHSIALEGVAFNAPLAVAMAVAFLVCGAGIVINDVFDAGADEKLHPNKPIPGKRISGKNALAYSIALFAVANALAAVLLPAISFVITLAFTALFILYSTWLRKAKYVGNWVVASGTAFTLIFGASILGNYFAILFFAVSALLANVAREIVKDIEDIEQDKGFKVSLPMVAGVFKAKCVALASVIAAVPLGYIPFALFGFGNIAFLVLLSAANIGFVYSAKTMVLNKYGPAQKWLKVSMIVALVAFLLGVLG